MFPAKSSGGPLWFVYAVSELNGTMSAYLAGGAVFGGGTVVVLWIVVGVFRRIKKRKALYLENY